MLWKREEPEEVQREIEGDWTTYWPRRVHSALVGSHLKWPATLVANGGRQGLNLDLPPHQALRLWWWPLSLTQWLILTSILVYCDLDFDQLCWLQLCKWRTKVDYGRQWLTTSYSKVMVAVRSLAECHLKTHSTETWMDQGLDGEVWKMDLKWHPFSEHVKFIHFNGQGFQI